MQILVKDLRLVTYVEFLLLSDEMPTLLSMREMIKNELDISIQKTHITHGEIQRKLKFENYFLIHLWDPEDIHFSLYTQKELRSTHRNFGHPSFRATGKLLRRATQSHTDKETLRIIGNISSLCNVCKRTAAAPRRFKHTIGADALSFNHSVQFDTIFLNERPILHIVDLRTHFFAADFLKSQSTKEVWSAMQQLCSMVYLGPPDHRTVNHGTNYTSKEMRSILSAAAVVLHEAPIGNPGTIFTVERYHAPLRASYTRIRADLDRETSDADCLQMAVFTTNTYMEPEGLCPTLLVFGIIPIPARTATSATQFERPLAIDNATKEL